MSRDWTEAELKPCPHCNGKAKLVKIKTKRFSSEEMVDAYCVICTNNSCGCLTQYCFSPEEAEKMWNRRASTEDAASLTRAHLLAHYNAVYSLADMVAQFGYSTTFRKQKAVCDGGLSALEIAFSALLDCGCKVNSNGTISLKNIFEFQEKFDKLRNGESEHQTG